MIQAGVVTSVSISMTMSARAHNGGVDCITSNTLNTNSSIAGKSSNPGLLDCRRSIGYSRNGVSHGRQYIRLLLQTGGRKACYVAVGRPPLTRTAMSQGRPPLSSSDHTVIDCPFPSVEKPGPEDRGRPSVRVRE